MVGFMEEADALEVPQAQLALLLDHFSKLDDEREPERIIYPLSEVLLLVTCGTIFSCDDFDEIVAWGEAHLGGLRCFSEFHFGIPCQRWLRTGYSMLPSRTTCRVPEPATARGTWPSCAASRSTSCAPTRPRAASKPNENQQDWTPKPSCASSRSICVDLDSEPCADARRQARQELSHLLVKELHAWFRPVRAQMSRHNPVTKAIDYIVDKDGRFAAWSWFPHDGRVPHANKAAERALHYIVEGRCGSPTFLARRRTCPCRACRNCSQRSGPPRAS